MLYRKPVGLARIVAKEVEVNIRKGTRKGGVESPKLFKIYVEEVMNKIKEMTASERINTWQIRKCLGL